MSSKREKLFGSSRSATHSSLQSNASRVPDSPTSLLEKATKKLFRTSIKVQDYSIVNAVAAVQLGPGGVFVPQEQGNQSTLAPTTALTERQGLPDFTLPNQLSPTAVKSVEAKNKDLPELPPLFEKPWLTMFPENVAPPSFLTTLPPPGTRFEDTAQLAYCNILIRKCLSPVMAGVTTQEAFDPSQRALIEPYMQDEEEQTRIRWLAQRVVEEFATGSFKSSTAIAEVVLLGPALDKEYYRKLLNRMIAEFKNMELLDDDLLQGLVQLVQCAGPDYLHPDDLVRILVVLRTRLQDTHQQTAKRPYYLALALSQLLDVMVDGNVQDLSRAGDHEPLSVLLNQMKESEDPYLKHQADYALQALLHVPNDETRRQFVLRHAGNIAMGLLGVASVCKLDFSGFSEGAGKIYDATVDALDIGTKVVEGTQSIMESGQGLWASVKGGILSGGRQLWYTALREAQEHIRNGRLADFNRFVFEAPCCQDVEFQWGICQFLGEIAVDPYWEMANRQHAVDFLAEFYRNESIRTSDENTDRCILNLLRQVSALPESALADHAQLLLQGLEKEGAAAKQDLYRVCLSGPVNPYPIKVRMSSPTSSTLLARVLDIPDVDLDLHRLRQQRLKERENVLYIPPQAKPSLQSKDDTLFPLMEKALEFLDSDRQVFLLLGDSGAGKSTFNLELENTLWKSYKPNKPIPLHINLPTIDKPTHDLIGKHLRILNFSEPQIRELKLHRQFIIICDGYDESQLKTNLHTTNLLNQPGQWKAKVVVSCRSQYLSAGYRTRFQPVATNRDRRTAPDLLQEAVIASFSRVQIQQYVEQYVKRLPARDLLLDRPSWTKEEYMEKLTKIPNLMDLVSNPFLLTVALEALPAVVDATKDLPSTRITRVELYDGFVKRWLEVNKRRLEDNSLNDADRSELHLLIEDGFVYHGIRYQKDLASAIFKEQAGAPVVQYTHLREGHTWKAAFFSPDAQIKLLRESSTVTRSGIYFRFIHRSLLEYFYSRTICDPIDEDADDGFEERSSTVTLKDILAQISIIGEPSIVQFLAERVDLDPLFKTQLLEAIEESKTDADAGVAAANAMSILVRAGHQFHGMDLRDIRIPGADLRGGLFDSVDFEGADLSDVNLTKAWIRQANLKAARMSGVQFGELPYLMQDNWVFNCVFSSSGKLLVVDVLGIRIRVYDTATWEKVADYRGGGAVAISPDERELITGRDKEGAAHLIDIMTGEPRLELNGHDAEVNCTSYSPDGTRVATAGLDNTIRIWSTVSGDSLHVLSKHTRTVTRVVFSPSGLQLASSSRDETVLIWDVQTGELHATLKGHTDYVHSVAFSPSGHQIASCGKDRSVRLWDARTYEVRHVLSGHLGKVECVAYSPDGHVLASCDSVGMIHLWSSQTGEAFEILSGHTKEIQSIMFSPTGDYLASGSWDRTVRLWKTGDDVVDLSSRNANCSLTCIDTSPCGSLIVTGNDDGSVRLWESLMGRPGAVLKGHTKSVVRVAFSPCGRRIASASRDHTVRLWDAQAGAALLVFEGHTNIVYSAAFSPSGQQIVSGGLDKAVQVWSTSTGEPGFVLEDHIWAINSVAYSPSGDQIAYCCDNSTVRLCCSQSGELQHVLEHNEGVVQVVYSPDGQYLVSLQPRNRNGSGGVSCWDPKSGHPVRRRLDGLDIGTTSCSFSPDGKFFATLGGDEWIRLWGIDWGGALEVHGSKIGRSSEVKWLQGVDCLYLGTITDNSLRVWKLVEKDEEQCRKAEKVYSLQLCWGTELNKLTVELAKLEGAIGLSTANAELMKQRGAFVNKD